MKNIDIKSLLDRKISWPVILVGLLFLASCAEQPRSVAELLRQDPAGFFSGLFHGGTIIFSFIGSIFIDVRIYAFPNTGGWYDFGYLIGASFFFGGMFTDA